MQTDRPLKRLQRRYFDWAEPHYLRLPAPVQAQARSLDAFLYSRRGLAVWALLLIAVLGLGAGLRARGLPWAGALALSLLLSAALALALLSAWLRPELLFDRPGGGAGTFIRIVAGVVLVTSLGWLAGRLANRGLAQPDELPAELLVFLRAGLPAGLLVALVMLLLMWVAASAGRQQMQHKLAQLHDAAERARVAREASEARLHLLQAQIQPHFVFNTLSAVQHWVDSGDARASALLRALTGFLRGSAELMLRSRVSLATELGLVEQYLQVMQARLGERLRYRLDIDAACAARVELPPGIVLSLVENAVEHGIGPSLCGGLVQLRLQPLPAAGGSWQLQLLDDGVGLPADWQEGLGLGNSRARLEQAFGGRASLSLRAQAPGTLVELCVTEEKQADKEDGHGR